MRRAALVTGTIALYAAVVLWLTWPLATHLTSHLTNTTLPAISDAPYLTWALAYESHALVTAPGRVFEGNIFHPSPHALFYGDTALGALPYFFPTFLLTGNPTLAINLVFLAGIVLTASALHLLIVRWTGSHAAGVVGAGTFLVNPWTLWLFLPWAANYALLHYLPAIVLLAATPARRLGAALRLVPVLVLQCLTNLVYVAPAVLAPLGVLALARLVRVSTRRAGLRLLLALALAVLVLAPFYAGHVRVRLTDAALAQQTSWRAPAREDAERLRSLLVPVGRYYYAPLPLPAGLAGGTAPTSLPFTAVVLILIGGVAAARRTARDRGARKAWTHGALWAGVGLVISAPAITVLGSAPVPLPHYLLLGWLAPGALEIIRMPARFGLVALIGLVVLTGVAFTECARRLAWSSAPAVLATVVVALLYLEYRPHAAAYPLRAAPTADSPLVRALQRGDGPLLELPVRDYKQPAPQTTAMYRSIFHWRPLLNGYANYWPPGFSERMALARQLPGREALEALRRETGLTTIAVRLGELDAAEQAVWLATAERGGADGLRLVSREQGGLLFAVEP